MGCTYIHIHQAMHGGRWFADCRERDEKWLDAFYDPVANLYTFTQCMCFGDIHADGDLKLVVAHLGTGTNDMKLKVYKGIICTMKFYFTWIINQYKMSGGNKQPVWQWFIKLVLANNNRHLCYNGMSGVLIHEKRTTRLLKFSR